MLYPRCLLFIYDLLPSDVENAVPRVSRFSLLKPVVINDRLLIGRSISKIAPRFYPRAYLSMRESRRFN